MRGRAARRLPLVAGRSWPGGLCMGLAACLLRKKASGGGAMVKSGWAVAPGPGRKWCVLSFPGV